MKFTPNANFTLALTCPKCAHVSEQRFWELEKTRQFQCPGCGDTVNITGDAFETIRDTITKA